MFSKILKLINEKYILSVHGGSGDSDVYENPTLSDISSIKRLSPADPRYFGIRFVVDLQEENVYVWDASRGLHEHIIDKLNESGKNLDWDYLAGGVLRLEDGKYLSDWDSLTFTNSSKQVQKAGMILSQYLTNTPRYGKAVWGRNEDFKDYNAWRLPNDKELKEEYQREYEIRQIKNWNLFDNEQDFINKAKKGELRLIDEAFDKQISYRSHTTSLEQLKNLVNSYRFPRDVDRIVKGFDNNDDMPVPIVLKFSKGYRVLSGNTRLDAAFILGVKSKVLIIDVSDKR